MSLERRAALLALCAERQIPLLEDDPYGELRFEGEDLPPLVSYSSAAPILYSGTGSKIMSPGMRVAWLVVPNEEIREKIVLAKQGSDLHSGTFAQYVFHEYVSNEAEFAGHVATIVQTYRRRRDVMAGALSAFASTGLHFVPPHGGMFLWVTVPGRDTAELLAICAEQKVVFVPGVSFYPNRDVHDGMRLNFSNASEEKIHAGIERLGHAIGTSKR